MSAPVPVYAEANHVVYHADLCAVVPWLDPVDHIWLDPPYGAVTHRGARTAQRKPIVYEQKTTSDLIDYESLDFQELLVLFGILSTRVRRWLFGTMEFRHITYLSDAPPAGLEFIRKGVWVKPNGMPQMSGDRPSTGHEDICIMHRAGCRKHWNGHGKPAVYVHNINSDGHYPGAKPESLVAAMVRDFTDPGDLILDPFCGSGTAAVVAKKLGRRSISIDRRSDAIALTIARLEATPEADRIVSEPRRGQTRLDI